MSPLVDLEAARARLAQLDAEREPLLAVIRAGEAYEQVVGKTLFETSSVRIRTRSKPQTAGRPAPILAATEGAVSEILDLLGPTPTGQLAEILAGRPELSLGAENRGNILSARLSNSEKFETHRGTGWWFKDRPLPKENEASPAKPEEASDAEEVGASSIENRPGFRLVS